MAISNFIHPHALTDRQGKFQPSIELCYGPHPSVHEAFLAVDTELRPKNPEKNPGDYSYIPLGLTVGVIEDGIITEYWFRDGHDEAHLVPKNMGSEVTDEAEENNDKPISSKGVYKIVGDIRSILETL